MKLDEVCSSAQSLPEIKVTQPLRGRKPLAEMEWAWAVRFIRIKTAFNYWRNGYKWRASWILAQR